MSNLYEASEHLKSCLEDKNDLYLNYTSKEEEDTISLELRGAQVLYCKDFVIL